MMRKLIELALAAGRKRQSPQTGLIHHFYHSQEDEPHRTIPLVENLLFSLALFRSRTVENVEEGKSLLERLLHFQAPEGNFPLYLHDYPECRDRYLGVHLLLPFYWIAAQFHHVLGSGLKKKLEDGQKRLLDYCQKLELPPAHAIKVAAASQKPLQVDLETYFSQAPAQMADALPALQILAPQLFFTHLEKQWNRKLLAYVGPAWCEWQEGSQPQVTLYDLYMGLLSGQFSARALQDQIVHLQAALIQPFEETFPAADPADFAIATIAQEEEWPRATDRSFHRLRAAWGSPQQLHTFSCQGGNIVACQHEPGKMVCTLGAPPPDGEREKCREVAFYLNCEAARKILVGSRPATTFYLGDEIFIQSDSIILKISFKLLEGSGDFVGHIMRGNRPSQLALKGANRNQAYDWQIFLRTLRRSDLCRIQVNIEGKNDVAPL